MSLTVTGPGGTDVETRPGYVVVTNPPASPFEILLAESDASMWFGGDDRPGAGPRNVGVGKSFLCPEHCFVYALGFRFTGPFDFAANPEGRGHQVTLVLNLRVGGGRILSTVEQVVPATFNGGWVLLDLVASLMAREEYIITCYLKDGARLGYSTGVHGHSGAPLPESQGYFAQTNVVGGDMEEWGIWSPHEWDFNVRVVGAFSDFVAF